MATTTLSNASVKEAQAIRTTMRLVWYIFYVVEVLILFRFGLKLFNAPVAEPFVDLVYSFTGAVAYPVLILGHAFKAENGLFEWTDLLAAVLFGAIAYGLSVWYKVVYPYL